MGMIWKSWKMTAALVITVLQIQALMSDKAKILNGVEGQSLDIRCEYPDSQRANAKYFCNGDRSPSSHLIWIDKHELWVRKGRFSLYDNTTGAFIVVRVDELKPADSGTYWCGVDVSPYNDTFIEIQLNISSVFGGDIKADTFHLQLVLTAAMCVAALLFVCLFTLSLLRGVKQQNSASSRNREISSDYETMMPGVTTAAETTGSHSPPDCTDLTALEPPPDDCSHITSKHRHSSVTPSLTDYVDVEELGQMCQEQQYQDLDPSLLEEHIYHSLHQSNNPKDQPVGVEDQSTA